MHAWHTPNYPCYGTRTPHAMTPTCPMHLGRGPVETSGSGLTPAYDIVITACGVTTEHHLSVFTVVKARIRAAFRVGTMPLLEVRVRIDPGRNLGSIEEAEGRKHEREHRTPHRKAPMRLYPQTLTRLTLTSSCDFACAAPGDGVQARVAG